MRGRGQQLLLSLLNMEIADALKNHFDGGPQLFLQCFWEGFINNQSQRSDNGTLAIDLITPYRNQSVFLSPQGHERVRASRQLQRPHKRPLDEHRERDSGPAERRPAAGQKRLLRGGGEAGKVPEVRLQVALPGRMRNPIPGRRVIDQTRVQKKY